MFEIMLVYKYFNNVVCWLLVFDKAKSLKAFYFLTFSYLLYNTVLTISYIKKKPCLNMLIYYFFFTSCWTQDKVD